MVAKYNMSPSKVPVLDFYLFFNPVDPICYSCIDEMVQSIEGIENKAYLHVIPYQNLQLVQQYMIKHKMLLSDLTIRNAIQEKSYAIATTFKAAQFQGKKKAHHFLMHLNHFTKLHHHNITDEMILMAAQLADLDLKMLQDDRVSENVKSLYLHDQQIANQFDVHHTPSLVMFDTTKSSGVLIENNITKETLYFALNTHNGIAQIK